MFCFKTRFQVLFIFFLVSIFRLEGALKPEFSPILPLWASPEWSRSTLYNERQTFINWLSSEARSISPSGGFEEKIGSNQSLNPLQGVPYADKTGIVISEKTIKINGAPFPYNSSLIKFKDGYLLFFRNDCIIPKRGTRFRVGVARLDHNFRHLDSKCFYYFSSSPISYLDPRAFTVGKKIFLVFYSIPAIGNDVWLAKINSHSLRFDNFMRLTTQSTSYERNWTFLVPNSFINNKLPFIHTLSPKINGTIDIKTGKITYTKPQMEEGVQENIPWKWGKISGGTPAIDIGGVYLSFFHSYLKLPKRFYVMGACTFAKKPPYELLSISPYPIVTKKMYNTKHHGRLGPIGSRSWSSTLDRVIFPCGIVLDKDKNGREVLYVSCGENDLTTRILTIDKERLLQSLVPIKAPLI